MFAVYATAITTSLGFHINPNTNKTCIFDQQQYIKMAYSSPDFEIIEPDVEATEDQPQAPEPDVEATDDQPQSPEPEAGSEESEVPTLNLGESEDVQANPSPPAPPNPPAPEPVFLTMDELRDQIIEARTTIGRVEHDVALERYYMMVAVQRQQVAWYKQHEANEGVVDSKRLVELAHERYDEYKEEEVEKKVEELLANRLEDNPDLGDDDKEMARDQAREDAEAEVEKEITGFEDWDPQAARLEACRTEFEQSRGNAIEKEQIFADKSQELALRKLKLHRLIVVTNSRQGS